MIANAPIESAPGILTETAKVDKTSLWDKLADLLRDTKSWIHIKAHQQVCDGRGTYLSLKDFYLGPNMVNELASGAEVSTTKIRYTGETKRWTFDSYVAVHKAQNQILSDLVEHEYQGMGEGTKVRHLTNGIKTDVLNVIKANILVSPVLQRDFNG